MGVLEQVEMRFLRSLMVEHSYLVVSESLEVLEREQVLGRK